MTKAKKLQEQTSDTVTACRSMILRKMVETARAYQSDPWPQHLLTLKALGEMSNTLNQLKQSIT